VLEVQLPEGGAPAYVIIDDAIEEKIVHARFSLAAVRYGYGWESLRDGR
jgi:hypothetical protein